MKPILATLLALVLTSNANGATTRNDDSCDIAVLPAATLLLPYFEVDLDDGSETTLVTMTNVSNEDAIARVTLWTDRGYPVFTFNVPLTGYDVQALNLFDVLGRGVIARDLRPRDEYSDPNPDLASCAPQNDLLGDAELARIRSALTTGTIDGECSDIGGVHEHATGFATIDVVDNCSANTPADSDYWIRDLRFDNVLMGDYQQLDAESARGGTLVHIRAVPEGEPSFRKRFPRTFYSRFTTLDARQPLPSRFAARFTEGTSLTIWREGRAGIGATCAAFAADRNLAVAEVVAFDERENGITTGERLRLEPSSKTSVRDARFPQLPSDSDEGWMYLDLDRSARDEHASQAWVISSTQTESGRATDVDAIAMGNGCAAPAGEETRIAPQDGDDSCDIALLPAATLLLPYFEVDLEDPDGQSTTFSITNVSAEDRIARVTLWTDYAYPVLTFNIYLTGYDVQSIRLDDVIARGIVAPDEGTGTQITPRGPDSNRNFALDLTRCARLPGPLPEPWVRRMQLAFTEGVIPGPDGCNNAGLEHDRAVGYATIDVVRNCEDNDPLSEAYWTEDLAWDNVLIGDSHQTNATTELAQASTMVHIRAIPEGGSAQERLALPRKWDAPFPRTFYSRFQPATAPKHDGRQPLPSVFATRWIDSAPAGYATWLRIWRDGKTGRDAKCSAWSDNVRSWTETVVFDEYENAWGDLPPYAPFPVPGRQELPITSTTRVDDSWLYPEPDNGAVAGWLYLNLDDDPSGAAVQNWVVATMYAAGRFSIGLDAIALGNGCSAEVPVSEVTNGTAIIGPRP
jgi:hypothetical protein